jgi:hypothetical protein
MTDKNNYSLSLTSGAERIFVAHLSRLLAENENASALDELKREMPHRGRGGRNRSNSSTPPSRIFTPSLATLPSAA